MKQYDTVNLSQLQYGDRFFIPGKRDLLYTFVGEIKKGVKGNFYDYEDDNNHFYHEKPNREVVFLRHKT